MVKKDFKINKRALVFALLASFGIAFSYFGYELYLHSSIVTFIKFVCLFFTSSVLLYLIYTHGEFKVKSERISKIMQFKPSNVVCLGAIMVVVYSLIITIFSQVNISPDGVAQLLWFNNYGCFDPSSRESLSGYWLSDHHPFLDTLIYGAFWKMGEGLFGSGLAGMRTLVYVQVLVWSIVLVLSCFWIQKRSGGRAKTTSLVVYVFMLLNPAIPLWISCTLKDITAMPFIIVWLMLLIDIVFPTKKKEKRSVASVVSLIFLSTLSILMRRSTVVSCLFIVCGLVCVSIYRFAKHRKVHAVGSSIGALTTVCALIISTAIVPSIAYPALNIAPVGPQESLSIPIQQTIGIVKNHQSEISESDLQKIEAVVPIEACMELYTSETADPVKDMWKRSSATDGDKREFLKVWAGLALKYPIDAFKSCRYLRDYVFESCAIVDYPTTWCGWDDKNAIELFSPTPQGYKTLGQAFACDTLDEIFNKTLLTPLRLPLNLITYTVWLPLIFFGYTLSRKNYKAMTSLFIPYSFALTLLTVAACQVRYAAPLMFFIPIIIGCVVAKSEESASPKHAN